MNDEKYVCYRNGELVGIILVSWGSIYTYTMKQLLYNKNIFGTDNLEELKEVLKNFAKYTGNVVRVDDKLNPLDTSVYDASKCLKFKDFNVSYILPCNSREIKNQIMNELPSLMGYIYNTDFLERFQICGLDLSENYLCSGNFYLDIESWIPWDTFYGEEIKDKLIVWFRNIGIKEISIHEYPNKDYTKFIIRFSLGQIKPFTGTDILPDLTKILENNEGNLYAISHNLFRFPYSFGSNHFKQKDKDIERVHIDENPFYSFYSSDFVRYIVHDGEIVYISLTFFKTEDTNKIIEDLKKELTNVSNNIELLNEFYNLDSPIECLRIYNSPNYYIYRTYSAKNFTKPFTNNLIKAANEALEAFDGPLDVGNKLSYEIDEKGLKIGLISPHNLSGFLY